MTEIYACATHGVLSGRGRPADRRVGAQGARAHRHGAAARRASASPKITTLSIAPLIGEAIKRIHRGESVGALFSSEVEFTQEMLLWEDGVARKLDIRVKPGEGEDGPSAEPIADLSELTAAATEAEER